MVAFGAEPARISDALIMTLRSQTETTGSQPKPAFASGERVLVTEGAFSSLEGIYHINDRKQRAIVFIELLHKIAKLNISPAMLRKMSE